MENLRNRRVIKFVVNEMQAKKVIVNPNFKSFNIINEYLVSVHLTNTLPFYGTTLRQLELQLWTCESSIYKNSTIVKENPGMAID